MGVADLAQAITQEAAPPGEGARNRQKTAERLLLELKGNSVRTSAPPPRPPAMRRRTFCRHCWLWATTTKEAAAALKALPADGVSDGIWLALKALAR